MIVMLVEEFINEVKIEKLRMRDKILDDVLRNTHYIIIIVILWCDYKCGLGAFLVKNHSFTKILNKLFLEIKLTLSVDVGLHSST